MAAVNKPFRNVIGERVREARLRRKPPLTQDELSGRLARKGIPLDRVAITKIELGLRCVFDYEVKALASVLAVAPNWLLGLKESDLVALGHRPTKPKRRA